MLTIQFSHIKEDEHQAALNTAAAGVSIHDYFLQLHTYYEMVL